MPKHRVHLSDKMQTYCGLKPHLLPPGDRWLGAKYKSDAPVKQRCERCFENEAIGLLQPTYMRDMRDAPQDGTRILLKYTVQHYKANYSRHTRHLGPLGASFQSGSWQDDGEKWEECRWVSEKEKTGSDPHWQPWCGNSRTRTTGHISPDHALGWRPLPENE